MKWTWPCLSAAALLTGCVDHDLHEPPVHGPLLWVSADTDARPAVVALRFLSQSRWYTVDGDGIGVERDGPYEVVRACDDATTGTTVSREIDRAPDTNNDTFVTVGCPRPLTGIFPVNGQMVQAGRLAIGEATATSATPSWGFTVQAGISTIDSPTSAIALADDAIEVRHDITIHAPVTLTPPLDVVQRGAPLAHVALTAANATASEVVTAEVALRSGWTSPLTLSAGPPGDARLAPAAVLTAADEQPVTMTAVDGGRRRSIRRDDVRVGDATAFDLPAPLAGLQLEEQPGALALRWDATLAPTSDVAPDVSAVLAGVNETTGRPVTYSLRLSPDYVAAQRVGAVLFDAGVPGLLPAWRLGPAPRTRTLGVSREHPHDQTVASVTETIPAPAAAR
jgi:hypothetical protein